MHKHSFVDVVSNVLTGVTDVSLFMITGKVTAMKVVYVKSPYHKTMFHISPALFPIYTHMRKLLLLLFIWVLRRFQQFFSHITTVSGCDRELNAHFYSAASLTYHVPDT